MNWTDYIYRPEKSRVMRVQPIKGLKWYSYRLKIVGIMVDRPIRKLIRLPL